MDRTRDALRRRLDGVAAPVVAVVGGAGPETVVTLLALLEDRVSFVLIHPRWTRAERDRAIANAGACLCAEIGGALTTTGVKSAPGGNPSIARGASIVFTSGTAGVPRGVVLSRKALRASARAHARAMGWRADDRWLLSLPTAHVGGLMIVVRCLHARRPVVVGGCRTLGNFDARETLRVVERDRVTLLSVVPTMLARLLQRTRRPPPSLRAVLVGGAAAPPALVERARAQGWSVLATYGLTEACSQVATERQSEARDGTASPVCGMEVSIGAWDSGADARGTEGAPPDAGGPQPAVARVSGAGGIGSIRIRGPMLFDGYLGDGPGVPLERPFDAEGWFDTGDLGSVDARGRLRVVGRRADRIVTGGENVDPVEVEAALLAWCGIGAASVVGIPDDEWGEKVGAVVVPAGGFDRDGGLDEVERRIGARLAGFKRPRRWRIVERLPTAPSGKVDLEACRRLLAQPPDQAASESDE